MHCFDDAGICNRLDLVGIPLLAPQEVPVVPTKIVYASGQILE